MRALSRASLAAAAVLVATVAGHSTSLMAVLHSEMPPAPPAIGSGHARQQLPDGPGKEVLARLCAGCHDLMFTVSTRETEAGWTRIVNDMRSKGADGTEEDFAKVIEYLTTHMGKKEPSAETARASMTLPVGDGGMPRDEEEFARAGVASRPPR
jgi:hypothetical protein